MHFSKIRLQGFKSFVDPTELQIQDGLTGVVGPNGCGKSNLLEALRWVMGESRPTQMRGGGMEDVIFQGAASRPAKHFAEVTLHIENEDRRAPAAFNDADELDVVRRITRDLGSAYKVNGKDARARDVSMMFADLATGAQSPSLVRQGQIVELINAKPQSRRRVLEDAAGISGLYARRHEAELKLNSAEANLLRSDDVIEQLNAQIRNLERQAKTAARYKSLSEELRDAQALRAYLEWRLAADKFVAVEVRLLAAQRARAAAVGARNDSERDLITAQDALPALRDEEAIAAALVQRLRLALEGLVTEEKRAAKTISDLELQRETLRKDQTREGQIAHDAAEAMTRLDWEARAIADEAQGEEEAILAAAEAARAAHDALNHAEAEHDEHNHEVAREEARAQGAERRFNEATARHHALVDTAENAAKDIATLEAELTAAIQDHLRLGAVVTAAQIQVGEAEAAIGAAERAHNAARALLDQARAGEAETKGQLSALRAEARGLSASLDRSARADHPVIDQISVDAGFEKALGAALGADLDAPLSEGDSGWQNFSALPSGGFAANIAPLADHVRAPEALGRRLSAIGVADVITREMLAALTPGQRLVTRQGDLYRWDGLVRLVGAGDNPAALRLEARNRLAVIEADISRLDAEARAQVNAIATAENAARAAKNAFEGAQNALRLAERGLTDAIRHDNAAQNGRDRLRDRLDGLIAAQDGRKDEIIAASSERDAARAARIDPEELAQAKAKREALRHAVELARGVMLDARAKVADMRKARDRRAARANDITRERANWQKRIDNSDSHRTDLERRLAENHDAHKAAIQLPGALRQKHLLLSSDLENAEARLIVARDRLAEGESRRARADQSHRAREDSLAQARENLARLEAETEAAKLDRDTHHAAIVESYNRTPEAMAETIGAVENLPPLDAVIATISRLSGAREAIGAVNLRADEDRADAMSELEKLVADREEISRAIAKLRTAIGALNKEGRERLLAAFDEVNANFRALFTKLFGGGDAHLELVENDDPLNAGLEIFAQPPGKRLTTLSLLSGGEQTLTALSLIFAVFLSNPAPICVLDEVDAPLDDANVVRFCDMLDEMVRQTETRFLIITHHALTMSRMDRLFGVTMREQGVSQLVSVDLRAAEALVEAG